VETLPFKGRVWVGMGHSHTMSTGNPIPIPAFPLKGKESFFVLEKI